MHQISFVGLGYVGLCTAVCFADKGYKTFISSHDLAKVNLVNQGTPPFKEPNLAKMLRKAISKKRLEAVLDVEEAVLQSDISFITVGTPSKPDGSINLRFIRIASEEIGVALKKKDEHHLVVVKSTVIPGTTEHVVKVLIERKSGKRCGKDFSLGMNPEFLREGSAIHDTLRPDRIIIGEHDKKSGDILEDVYQEFYGKKLPPIVRTNLQSAELIKYANNTFLAAKVSFINTIANICEKIPGADVTTVAKGIGLDKRIGLMFLNAGLGYGGSCLPKDVKALTAFSKGLGYHPVLIDAIENVNEAQPFKAVELAKKLVGTFKSKRVAILGLAFKPDTDDMREAVSIKVIDRVLKEGATVVVYDPLAMKNAAKILGERVEYASSAIACLKDADCCIIVTEWDEFKKLKLNDFIKNMKSPVLIDGRRVYDPQEYSGKLKFAAIGLGHQP